MEQQDSNDTNSSQNEDTLPEVQQELSKVAASPKQSILILVGICIVFGYLFFVFFLNNKNPAKEVKPQAPAEVTKPVETAASDIPAIPQLPEPPKLVEPSAPPPPPAELQPVPSKSNEVALPTPAMPLDNNLSPPPSASLDTSLPTKLIDSDEARKRKETKRKSAIVLAPVLCQKKLLIKLKKKQILRNAAIWKWFLVVVK